MGQARLFHPQFLWKTACPTALKEGVPAYGLTHLSTLPLGGTSKNPLHEIIAPPSTLS
ncbi:hypothetical protein MTYM_02199 [Methylococcales bacterium]|nr:hypothetical protein MTYM_02199 [Methylococcales bacterium]